MFNKIEGRKGEAVAVDYLKNKGYKILNTNMQLHYAEADIVAEKDGVIVFVEVKYRQNADKGHPLEAVTDSKQRGYRLFAMQYVNLKSLQNRDLRFDVIGILGDEIFHIENAF